jgi:hypothetical protein
MTAPRRRSGEKKGKSTTSRGTVSGTACTVGSLLLRNSVWHGQSYRWDIAVSQSDWSIIKAKTFGNYGLVITHRCRTNVYNHTIHPLSGCDRYWYREYRCDQCYAKIPKHIQVAYELLLMGEK